MVLKENIKNFYKRTENKTSSDSIGGSDYVNDSDEVTVDKFNRRWNNQDEDIDHLVSIFQKILRSYRNSKTTSKLYEYNNSLSPFKTISPFHLVLGVATSNLDLAIVGAPDVVNIEDDNENITLPTAVFVDWIEKGNEQFSITIGSTNLFEIQGDVISPPITKTSIYQSDKRWYRLGHDGTEAPAVPVEVSKTLSTPATWGVVEIEFYDWMNVDVSGYQRIEINSLLHSEQISITLDGNQSEYLAYVSLWDGGALNPSGTFGTGVTRTIGKHSILIACYQTQTQIFLDGVLLPIYTQTDTMEQIDILRFRSNDISGGVDYLDIYRFNVYQTKYITLTPGKFEYIYIDRIDGDIKITDQISTANDNIVIYTSDLPLGSTTITVYDYSDVRNISSLVTHAIMNEVKFTRSNNKIYIDDPTKLSNYLNTPSNVRNFDEVYLSGNASGAWSILWDSSYNTAINDKVVTFIGDGQVTIFIQGRNVAVITDPLDTSVNSRITFIGLIFQNQSSGNDEMLFRTNYAKFERCRFINDNTTYLEFQINNTIITHCRFDIDVSGNNAIVAVYFNNSTKSIISENIIDFIGEFLSVENEAIFFDDNADYIVFNNNVINASSFTKIANMVFSTGGQHMTAIGNVINEGSSQGFINVYNSPARDTLVNFNRNSKDLYVYSEQQLDYIMLYAGLDSGEKIHLIGNWTGTWKSYYSTQIGSKKITFIGNGLVKFLGGTIAVGTGNVIFDNVIFENTDGTTILTFSFTNVDNVTFRRCRFILTFGASTGYIYYNVTNINFINCYWFLNIGSLTATQCILFNEANTGVGAVGGIRLSNCYFIKQGGDFTVHPTSVVKVNTGIQHFQLLGSFFYTQGANATDIVVNITGNYNIVVGNVINSGVSLPTADTGVGNQIANNATH